MKRTLSLEGRNSLESGGFTTNLRNSIARRSTALARFAAARSASSSGYDGDAAAAVAAELANRIKRTSTHRFSMGDSALIYNQHLKWGNGVNRYGFPPGQGTTTDEQRGPYVYILGTVKTVHYEENAVFYTVTRVDTGVDIRGDPDFMEPILNQAGEEAARKAATAFAMGNQMEDLGEEEDSQMTADGSVFALKRCLSRSLEILLLPFFVLYDLFVFAIGARLFRWAEAAFIFSRRQAHSFLYGLKPYECSTTVTTVNLIVLCTVWYMFVDQARVAFCPPEFDDTLAVINFVVWSILSVELMFEVFIRPDEYGRLIQSDKAYMPTTARFISGLHLVVEFVSLAFFVPEFLCLFTDISCHERPTFSFLNATMLAIAGPTFRDYAMGRLFYACIRLRVFALVRHWRNRWLNTKFSKRPTFAPGRKILDWKSYASAPDRSEVHFAIEDDDTKTAVRVVNRQRLQQKERDAALINASNIGTALMLTNSYRALCILCAITGIFPMITLISTSGIARSATSDMIQQLSATNLMVTTENDDSCRFLVDSVEAWAKSWRSMRSNLITADTVQFLATLVMKPARCQEEFLNLTIGRLRFELADCDDVNALYDMNVGPDECILGSIGSRDSLDLRVGNLQTTYSGPVVWNATLRDGSERPANYQVGAQFNQTFAIESSALASFLLQFCLLMTVLLSLSILRRDAEGLVLGPLRSMLKIVARYAKNPLSQAGPAGRDNISVISDIEAEELSAGSEGEDGWEVDNVNTYETEQLITAVAKITDLLRKCWGVAGADIISTNLASREGALAEVFNPTVPGKSVYALFGFVAIDGFDHALKCLGGDVMILINDVASVLHNEVYRWGFGDSGQCNKNLGSAFLMVFRIGLVKEVDEKLKEAAQLVFSTSDTKKISKKRSKVASPHVRSVSEGSKQASWARLSSSKNVVNSSKNKAMGENDADAKKLSLQSLPGIAMFTDRAVIGMLKSFAGINRDKKLRGWSRDFRLSAGVGTFEVHMIFGMDAGWAVEGAVGSNYKIDATYLSPHVNMASRMMSACKHYGVTILLSEAVQELMSDTAKSKLRNVDRVTVKGSVTVQKIYTFDARRKADFFLFGRSDEAADLDAEQYVPSIWNTDQDLHFMRQHVTPDFESEFNAGMKAYYAGDWPAAIKKLENANEIMVEAAMEEGYLHDEMDDSPDRKELYRNETADGPCTYLIHFMKSQGGVAPEGWDGWHPLLSK